MAKTISRRSLSADFQEVDVYGKYPLLLPKFLVNTWDVFDSWEKTRFEHMQANLKRSDTLFDIGAERGWQSALLAKYAVDDICLFEPSEAFWPNIIQTFKANDLPIKSVCGGFIGDHSSGSIDKPKTAGPMDHVAPYKDLYKDDLPQITLDDWVQLSGIQPEALNIDVEGSELLVLKGAEKTLQNLPLIWLSMHLEKLLVYYGTEDSEIHAYLASFGYKAELIDTDHETHFFFYPG